jgi:hypothetical protein
MAIRLHSQKVIKLNILIKSQNHLYFLNRAAAVSQNKSVIPLVSPILASAQKSSRLLPTPTSTPAKKTSRKSENPQKKVIKAVRFIIHYYNYNK